MLICPKYLAGAVAIMTVAISGPTKAQRLDGFESARWGMSMQQVQSAFGGRLVPFTPPGDDASSPKFGFPHYDVDGCNFEVDFKFENERLVRVDLVLISDSMDAAECPTKIAENLTAKHGLQLLTNHQGKCIHIIKSEYGLVERRRFRSSPFSLWLLIGPY